MERGAAEGNSMGEAEITEGGKRRTRAKGKCTSREDGTRGRGVRQSENLKSVKIVGENKIRELLTSEKCSQGGSEASERRPARLKGFERN
jgi:hypothetical protein